MLYRSLLLVLAFHVSAFATTPRFVQRAMSLCSGFLKTKPEPIPPTPIDKGTAFVTGLYIDSLARRLELANTPPDPARLEPDMKLKYFSRSLGAQYTDGVPTDWFDRIPNDMGGNGAQDAYFSSILVRKLLADAHDQSPEVKRVFASPNAFLDYYQIIALETGPIIRTLTPDEIARGRPAVLRRYATELANRAVSWQDLVAVLLTMKLGTRPHWSRVRLDDWTYEPGAALLKSILTPERRAENAFLLEKWELYFGPLPAGV